MTVIFNDILKLTKQLFPTGRAWRISENSTLKKLLYALGKSEQRAFLFALSTLDRILPDNENFTTGDATEWERRLNISGGVGYVPLSIRKSTILRKYQFPGGFLNRQNYRYIQAQLQLAGYNVTISENFSPLPGVSAVPHSSTTKHGAVRHALAVAASDICANSADKGELLSIDTYKGCFYIDGSIPVNAVKAFRILLLTLKPVNTVAILRLNYTEVNEFVYMDGDYIGLMDGGQLILMK